MRIVLVAYDFPPIPSPQSLRWAYLVRELAWQGHEVHVLTPDMPGYGNGGLPEIPSTVSICRVYPGPLSALLRGRSRKRIAPPPLPAGSVELAIPASSAHEFHELNWKGRLRYRIENGFRRHRNWKGALAERLKRILSRVIFPDYRAEWLPWAKRDMRRLLAEVQPDIVVTSHEPACSLLLGLDAKRLGYRWVADLGDPVLATYTPQHWKTRAHQLERDVCQLADMVCVTTERTAVLLKQRHGISRARCLVLTQGFDAAFVDRECLARVVSFDEHRLELLYTGSFYSFRRADALIAAVEMVPGVRLSVATINAPDYLLEAVERHPEKFRLLGFLSHTVTLSAQRRCDVLVNIANADSVQIPGKVYEYLGSARPMIHLRGGTVDATSDLLDLVGGGWHMPSGTGQLIDLLKQLKRRKGSGQLPEGASDPDRVASHSWQYLANLWDAEATQLLDSVG